MKVVDWQSHGRKILSGFFSGKEGAFVDGTKKGKSELVLIDT